MAVTIRGRAVLQTTGKTRPAEGARIRLVGVWRAFPPANQEVPAAGADLIYVQPPVAAARPAGTALRGVAIELDRKNCAELLEDATGGAARLLLSRRAGLVKGSLLAVDCAAPDRIEYLPVDSLPALGQAAPTGWVALDGRLAFPHPAGAAVCPAVLRRKKPHTTLVDRVLPGDRCLFVEDVQALQEVRAGSLEGAGPPSIHEIFRYTATSDRDGYFRLPPISRVAQVELEASIDQKTAAVEGDLAPIKVIVSPDYNLTDQRVDFVFFKKVEDGNA